MKLKGAECGEIFHETPLSTRTRQIHSNRTGQTSKWKSCRRGKSADTQQSGAQVDTHADDDSDLAKKVLIQSHDQSDVTVPSTLSEGVESGSTLVRPVGGTLNDWHMCIRHHTASFEGFSWDQHSN